MVRVPTHRAPIHAGEILLEEFLNPMGLSRRDLADAIHVDPPPQEAVQSELESVRGMTTGPNREA